MMAAASPVAAADSDPPTISHDEVKTGKLGRPIAISATITDPAGVFDPVVLYRVGGEGRFLRQPMQPVEGKADIYVAMIPGEVVSGDLEYFIEAFDNNGNGPARYAEEELPVSIRVLATAEPLPDPETPPPDDGDNGGEVVPEDEGGGAGLWIGLGVGAAVVVVAAAIGAGAGIYFLTLPPAIPDRVDVAIGAPGPITQGASP
jgi:hypothetical protein